jgi:peptidase E
MIVLMGSGELTATMVEVHKELLAELPHPPQAVFLDTPAGFQLNADHISERAADYFRRRIQRELTIASFKSSTEITPREAEQAFRRLGSAHYILIGPGSPTYAVRHWRHSPIGEILRERVTQGGCLVAASAAALTVGRMTLPVYEIYKVGEDLHWVEGLNILGHFDLDLAVIPHWNNAEGGTHDTRCCYMGQPRFARLESLLPPDTAVLGLDEHTACVLDFSTEQAHVRGVGGVTLRRRGNDVTFGRGERFPLELLRGAGAMPEGPAAAPAVRDTPVSPGTPWERMHALETAFRSAWERRDPGTMSSALLELDQILWQAHDDLEHAESISQGRELLRELIVLLGVRQEADSRHAAEGMGPLIEGMLAVRENFRRERRWAEADAIRTGLLSAGIVVEDTPGGVRWQRQE